MVALRRDNGKKITIPLEGHTKGYGGNDKMVVRITVIESNTARMYTKAEREINENVVICRKWSQCGAHLAAKRLILIPFYGRPICKDNLKQDTTLYEHTLI